MMSHEAWVHSRGGLTNVQEGVPRKEYLYHKIHLAEKVLTPFLDWQIRAQGIPGLAYGVVDKHGIIASGGFGFANKEKERPMTPNSIVRCASLEKYLTAIVIGQFIQEGKLYPDTRLDSIFEHDFVNDPKVRGITIDQLVSHSAGVRRDARTYHDAPNNYPNDEELMSLLNKSGFLIFEPGNDSQYSNVGFALLGKIIERVGGQPYSAIVQKRILDRLHMNDTLLDAPNPDLPNLARGYKRRGLGGHAIDYPQARAMAPAFGLYSTVADLGKLASAQMQVDDNGLTQLGVSWRWMRDVVKFPDVSYGKGTMVYDIDKIGHSGSHEGSSAIVIMRKLIGDNGMIPDNNLAVIMLANVMDAPKEVLSQQVFRLINQFRLRMDVNSKLEKVSNIQDYTGLYQGCGADRQMIDLDGSLVSFMYREYDLDPLLAEERYAPTEDPDFFRVTKASWDGYRYHQLHFVRDENGIVVGYEIGTKDDDDGHIYGNRYDRVKQ